MLKEAFETEKKPTSAEILKTLEDFNDDEI